MYSPSQYLTGIILDHLKDYIENFDPAQLSVGLWSGEIKLSDLNLKKLKWNYGLRHYIQLEYATINKLEVKIPWAKLYSGVIETNIEDINIVLRLYELNMHSDEGVDSFLDRQKCSNRDFEVFYNLLDNFHFNYLIFFIKCR